MRRHLIRSSDRNFAASRICQLPDAFCACWLQPAGFVDFVCWSCRTSKNAHVAMIDLTEQAAVHPTKQPRDQQTRFVKLKPSQRPGLACSTLTSSFVPATSGAARLTRPPKKRQPLQMSAPSWRGDQSSSGDSSDESSEDSDDCGKHGRRPQHAKKDVGRPSKRPAARNMLQVRSRPHVVRNSSLHLRPVCRRWPTRWTQIHYCENTERCRWRNKAVCCSHASIL